MEPTKEEKRREQDTRQREIKKTLDTFSTDARLELNFVTEADTCIKHIQTVFVYFCCEVNKDHLIACSDAQAQFKILLSKILEARSVVQHSHNQLCEILRSSRELPNALNNREEIGNATDVILDGLLIKAKNATAVINEHVKHAREALANATKMTAQIMQTYKENENVRLKEGS